MSESVDWDHDVVYRLCIRCQQLKGGTMYHEGIGTICLVCSE
jgi:hypothetical protein